jgi:hypothetical protein
MNYSGFFIALLVKIFASNPPPPPKATNVFLSVPVFVFLGVFAIFQKATIVSSCLYVRPYLRPHETGRLPLDGFSYFNIFRKPVEEYLLNFIKFWQE